MPRAAPALLLALLGLAVSPAARADLGGSTAGAWLDAGAGLGAGDLPFRAGVGWTAAVGGFFGRYDSSLAVGRHVAIGARARQDVQLAPGTGRDELRTALLVDAHRGIDLLAIAIRFGGVAGPLLLADLDGDDVRVTGGTVRAAGSLGWRFDARAALQLRVEAGIDVDRLRVEPALGVTLGIEALLPARRAR